MQKGAIMKDGIICGCCSKIVTFSKLEEHSGSKLGDPFPNIFLESGKSLMQCQIDAWEKLGELEKTDFYTVDVDGDDTCGLCDEGGNLICCDGCPSTLSPKQLRYRDHESCRPELDYQKLHCLGPILHDNSFLILADEGEYPLIEPLLLYGHGRDGTGGLSSGLIGGTLHLTDYANVTL
ncbi:increased DNA methylation 1-like protein [Tanacetum coccineum]